MIQRIQTILLLAVAIISGLLFFTPMFNLIMQDNTTYEFYTSKVVSLSENPALIAYNWMSLTLNIAITLLSLIVIFLYKKRFLQLRLCIVNIILQLGMLILMWLQASQRAEELQATYQVQLSFCFPIIGIILTWLALRAIIKDINLLKSYDRMR